MSACVIHVSQVLHLGYLYTCITYFTYINFFDSALDGLISWTTVYSLLLLACLK